MSNEHIISEPKVAGVMTDARVDTSAEATKWAEIFYRNDDSFTLRDLGIVQASWAEASARSRVPENQPVSQPKLASVADDKQFFELVKNVAERHGAFMEGTNVHGFLSASVALNEYVDYLVAGRASPDQTANGEIAMSGSVIEAIERYAEVREQRATWKALAITPDQAELEQSNVSAAKAAILIAMCTQEDSTPTLAATPLFTHVQNGGEYVVIATAMGAGQKLGSDTVTVFRNNAPGGDFHYSELGDFSRNFAPITSTPELVITIMPEYGMSAYAWVKEVTDLDPWVGMSEGGYLQQPTRFPITEDLHNKFVAWSSTFEALSHQPDFDWVVFHTRGLELTRLLKRQVGRRFRVLYRDPNESRSIGREVL